MIYTNITLTGIYVQVPGHGHAFCAPGKQVKIDGHVNVPGLVPEFVKTPAKKKAIITPQPTIVAEKSKDNGNVRTGD